MAPAATYDARGEACTYHTAHEGGKRGKKLAKRYGMVSGCYGIFLRTHPRCIWTLPPSWVICLRHRRNASGDAGSAVGSGQHVNGCIKLREGIAWVQKS
jgi:hypothetical protein